jgi:hypothetical protein
MQARRHALCTAGILSHRRRAPGENRWPGWLPSDGAARPGELLSGPPDRCPRSRLRRWRSTWPGAAPQPRADSAPSSPSSTAAPARGSWTATTAASSCCPAPIFCTGGAKREQWYSLAERAPDEATAAWLHQVFAPTAAAIDELEAALAGLGVLDEALAVDLRRPQDYFQRIWNTGFRAAELIRTTENGGRPGKGTR